MSDWTDDDGNPLGEWKPCTNMHATDVLYRVLGDERTVFASRTEMGDGDPVRNQHIHTEWGRKGDDAPVIRCERDIDSFGERTHVDYEFVRATS